VIVVTANHYFLDAPAGFFVLGVGYVLARVFTRAGRGPAIAARAPSAAVSRPNGSSGSPGDP
jgi:hypothetical protein